MNKMLFCTLVALAGVSAEISAYTYTVTNYTNQTLLVDVRPYWLLDENRKPWFIKPNQTFAIDLSGWSSGLCLSSGSVFVAPVDAQTVSGFTGTLDDALVILETVNPGAQPGFLNAATLIKTKLIQMLPLLQEITCLTPDNAPSFFKPVTGTTSQQFSAVGTDIGRAFSVLGILVGDIPDSIKTEFTDEVTQWCSSVTIGIFSNNSSYSWTFTDDDSWLSDLTNATNGSTWAQYINSALSAPAATGDSTGSAAADVIGETTVDVIGETAGEVISD